MLIFPWERERNQRSFNLLKYPWACQSMSYTQELLSTVCHCQCVWAPSICSKISSKCFLPYLYDERDYIICAFSFIPYLVCRCTLGFGMPSALSLMFLLVFCSREREPGNSPPPLCSSASVSGAASYEWDWELNGRQRGSTVSLKQSNCIQVTDDSRMRMKPGLACARSSRPMGGFHL